MTDTERLILEGIAAILDTSRYIAHGTQTFRSSNRAKLVQDQIDAVLDSQAADEVDALK